MRAAGILEHVAFIHLVHTDDKARSRGVDDVKIRVSEVSASVGSCGIYSAFVCVDEATPPRGQLA